MDGEKKVYKVIADITFDGMKYKTDDHIELTKKEAKPFLKAKQIELVK